MIITIATVSLCAGQGHAVVTGTVGGQARTLTVPKSDFALDPDDLVTAFVARCRSAIKESGAVTLGQMRAALEGKSFQI